MKLTASQDGFPGMIVRTGYHNDLIKLAELIIEFALLRDMISLDEFAAGHTTEEATEDALARLKGSGWFEGYGIRLSLL
jgi:hypothetical protein